MGKVHDSTARGRWDAKQRGEHGWRYMRRGERERERVMTSSNCLGQRWLASQLAAQQPRPGGPLWAAASFVAAPGVRSGTAAKRQSNGNAVPRRGRDRGF